MSSRQIDILQALSDGLSCREIAKEWRLTSRYVRRLTSTIREHLGADTNCQAVAMGIRRGLID